MNSIHPPCIAEGCNRPFHCKGYCTMHYHRYHKYGDLRVGFRNMPGEVPKHNLCYTPEYRIYHAIKDRCYRKKHASWLRYGGRGIKMCDKWLGIDGAENFLQDMGNRPTSKHSIDRINPDGDYEPSNCRWATPMEQSWNKNKLPSNTSGYIGVVSNWGANKWGKHWKAQLCIRENGRRINYSLGTFDEPEEAAIEYDKAIIFFRGDRAITNIL